MRYQSFWLGLNTGIDQMKKKRLAQYQSEAFANVCESRSEKLSLFESEVSIIFNRFYLSYEPHKSGGRYHVLEGDSSTVTWIYQPTSTSINRQCVKIGLWISSIAL